MSDLDPAPRKSRTPLYVTIAVIAVIVLGIGLYLFQPWALFTSTQVNEDLPSAPSGTPTSSVSPNPTATAATNLTLASGSFQSFEHSTTGKATLIRLADGRTVVRLTDFKTSNGPDVKVWLSANPASKAEDSRSAAYVSLGDLKGNVGNQNYVVPNSATGQKWNSVVIWCDRFSVPFGAADLEAVAPAPRS